MKIAAVVHYYLPRHRAGAEVMLHELLRPLAARGHDVTVWATDQAGEHQIDGVRVRAGRPARLAADVVVTHLKEVPHARALACRAAARLVQVLHSDAPWIARAASRGADLFVANTDWVAAALAPHLRGPRLVVHPPVWPERHATTPGHRVTLVNPLPEKGAALFYELAERMPDTPFLAVEGGYQQSEQIRPAERFSNVAWQPHTEDMRRDVWSRTRVLLMPSHYESYGMCAIEAAASGIPTIATPTPGLREALGPGGVFVPAGDASAWETQLRAVLGTWPTASAAARARSSELTPSREVRAWIQAVESLS